jgi:hypothetical protein
MRSGTDESEKGTSAPADVPFYLTPYIPYFSLSLPTRALAISFGT